MGGSPLIVGLISDTHGLLRPAALEALAGTDHILHAGDIGRLEILNELRHLAPVTAVRGNVDRGKWAAALPDTTWLELAGIGFGLLHDITGLALRDCPEGVNVVVYGHSHVPLVEQRDGLLYVNPGSAGPRRFKLPVSLARLHIQNAQIRPEFINLG